MSVFDGRILNILKVIVVILFSTTIIKCQEDSEKNVSSDVNLTKNMIHIKIATPIGFENSSYPSNISTVLETGNTEETKTNTSSKESNSNRTKVTCLLNQEYSPVEIINATKLLNIVLEFGSFSKGKNAKEGKQSPGHCMLIMFFAKWCIFSSQAAPHFNALPRFFPHIKFVAIDAMKYHTFNTQYGIVGVPTLMLIHNGKPVAKFNDTSYTLETFSKFITEVTTLQPNESLYVTSADFNGPLSSIPDNEMDIFLILSWLFCFACALYYSLQSHWWRQFVELVQNTWRESNAEHEHAD